MLDILATVDMNDIIIIGSGLGILTAGKYAHGRYTTRNADNGDGKFSQRLCDEMHANLNREIAEVKSDVREGFSAVFTRLDKIQDRLMK